MVSIEIYTIIQVGNFAGRMDGQEIAAVNKKNIAIQMVNRLYDEQSNLFIEPWDGFVIVGPDGNLIEW